MPEKWLTVGQIEQQGHTFKQKINERKRYWQSQISIHDPMWEYMDPLKVEERKRWMDRRRMHVAARRVCWLAAPIYGSRHSGVYFCLPVSLETKKDLARDRGSQSVKYCVSYLQLFCLGGRQSIFIFAWCLSNVWDVSGFSAALTTGATTFLTLIVALQRKLFSHLHPGGFYTVWEVGPVSKCTVCIFAIFFVPGIYLPFFKLHLSKLYFSLFTQPFFVSACFPHHSCTETHGGFGYGYMQWSSISANVSHLLFMVVDLGKRLCWAKVELQTQRTTVCGRWRAHQQNDSTIHKVHCMKSRKHAQQFLTENQSSYESLLSITLF